MKNSKEYAKKVQTAYRALKRKYPKVQKIEYDNIVDALVYAVVSENLTAKAVESAMKHFGEYFVDHNDLRVSRAEEIIEILGEDTSVTRDTALMLTTALRVVFEKYNTVSLEALKKVGKRPAKQILEQLGDISHFVVDYCMLTSLKGHAIPLTNTMVEYLKSEKLVHPDSDDPEITGFLVRQISSKDACEFYGLLRQESELNAPKLKKKAKVKVAKKTTKKVKEKVKTKAKVKTETITKKKTSKTKKKVTKKVKKGTKTTKK